MAALLGLVFFASGAAALLFETLWFRQAGLMLGNSVWATSLVTSGFMGGLALGNAWAIRYGGRSPRPLHLYAKLETAIGITGVALVLLLPRLTGVFAPAFTPFVEHPAILNTLRFTIALLLLLVPATAMGATLPILAGALTREGRPFGRVLGILYGSNTLGAVAGALSGELWLIERFGIRGTAMCAFAINAAAVVAALWLSRHLPGPVTGETTAELSEGRNPPNARAARLLSAAFLSGALLLSLEVVWFRLLLLFIFGTSLAFAVMLAVVLLGIGVGGFIAAATTRSDERAARALPGVALAAGAVTAWTYAALSDVLRRFDGTVVLLHPDEFLTISIPLMLPTSLLSGVLFTLMGSALRAGRSSPVGDAGALTLANTTGAAIGALLGTFVVLPALGMERTLFAVAAAYGLVALLVRQTGAPMTGTLTGRAFVATSAVAYVVLLVFFPFGLMERRFARRPIEGYLAEKQVLLGHREGLTETISYMARDLWGEPASYRLVTNAHSMSGTHFASARYMRYFVYLPVALHPEPTRALLISYGVGLTAKALTETEALKAIDVVDISRDILEMGRIVFPRPGTFPLDDPRVRVHVEDGRFFLLTTDKTFDIITSEPPPPKGSGIVNLYAREYFELIRSRLAPGGLASYWLPVYQMNLAETKSMIRGFCDALPDCSLWAGAGLEWMLIGSNGLRTPVEATAFERQWHDARVGPILRSLGFDRPESFGTTFLADAAQLREMTVDALPLEDNYPLRLSARADWKPDRFYFDYMRTTATKERFAASAYIRAVWPPDLRERTLNAFDAQQQINRGDLVTKGLPPLSPRELEAILTTSTNRVPILTSFLTEDSEISAARNAVARGVLDPFADELLGIGALADRDYQAAALHFQKAEAGEHADEMRPLRVVALGLAGRAEEAKRLLEAGPAPSGRHSRSAWAELQERYGIKSR